MAAETRAPETVVAPAELDNLIGVLRGRGYQVIGPTIRDGAIIYAEITTAAQLPTGWTDAQEAATYRLERRSDEARFGYAVGPHSWKQCLLPPRLRLLRVQRDPERGFDVREEPPPDRPMALLGVRSCELHAIAIQDRILADGRHPDDDYAARRADLFIVAVNCHEPGGTCFCASMDTGPAVSSGYDLVLSEILDGEHRLLVEAGTARGREVLDQLASQPARPVDREAAAAAVRAAADRMGRTVEARGLRDLLADNLEHPRWDDVAGRCLTCGNCTMVCPTCFCTTVEDVGDLAGGTAERWRSWESCFSLDHSHLHGGDVRAAPRSRYRQWLTHKFGTWHDQFGTSGCVGCGRCITWCPVGIDVTEELAAIRGNDVDGDPPAVHLPPPTDDAAARDAQR
ncbi:4Fe-4S dicluster domain-containing protein [Pseudofrankia saprophytica]|uniref:4Fe-4S dicluster domain-containing protein n=1 Tax=Pseudofrankia saprophytica TaxID=298655 RepID=UPI000234D7BD|nr:4Fe-4S dicluster domain-containing protein [Pseudofrankia saprophytica]